MASAEVPEIAFAIHQYRVKRFAYRAISALVELLEQLPVRSIINDTELIACFTLNCIQHV